MRKPFTAEAQRTQRAAEKENEKDEEEEKEEEEDFYKEIKEMKEMVFRLVSIYISSFSFLNSSAAFCVLCASAVNDFVLLQLS